MPVGQSLQFASPDRVAQPVSTLRSALRTLLLFLAMVFLGALLIMLLYQLPARHMVNIGAYDAAYVQGFFDPETDDFANAPAYLAGSDGSVRWSRDRSFLLFPQSGLPAHITLRLRGWRDTAPPPHVTLLLNGQTVCASFQTSGAWQSYTCELAGGFAKATDIFLEVRSDTTTLSGDDRQIGVLLDAVDYRVMPGPGGVILPYPAQVVYGGLITGLFWLLIQPYARQRKPWITGLMLGAGLLLLAVLFVWLYRLPPPFYPYPLRGLLPGIALLLAALLAVRHGPTLLVRYPALVPAGMLLGVLGWGTALLLVSQGHVTLSVPGVEKDFRVFATRAVSLQAVLRADGFYNLGYPLLLWLVRPLTSGNVFLAARLVAIASGMLLLLSTYFLAAALPVFDHGRRSPRLGALLAMLMLALSPFVIQYALYVGSDMPFAACTTLALALLLSSRYASARNQALILLAAGLASGAAFLIRHPGLLLLPWGLLYLLLAARLNTAAFAWSTVLRQWLLFAPGFLLAAAPQVVVNLLQTGQPLYNEQAKNIWLAVYGGIDWGRWGEVPDTISLTGIVLRDPVRFLGNWGGNLRAFVGNGAEDTTEFGRALQLRLLAWPANWLAIAGLLGWLYQARCAWRRTPACTPGRVNQIGLLLFAALYVAAVSLAFVLPRFFLPLAPIYAVAGAWLLCQVLVRDRPIAEPTIDHSGSHANQRIISMHQPALLMLVLLMLVLLWNGFGIGTRYVLEHQPADEVAIIALARTTLQPGDKLAARLPDDVALAKYSALAHQIVPWPQAADDATALAQIQAQGADYLLWDQSFGPPPEGTSAAAIGSAGGYILYRLVE